MKLKNNLKIWNPQHFPRFFQGFWKHPPNSKMDVEVSNTSFNLTIDDNQLMNKGVIGEVDKEKTLNP